MNSNRKRKTRSSPSDLNSCTVPVSTQSRVKNRGAASKNPPQHIPEETNASNSSRRRSLRSTINRIPELLKPDKVEEKPLHSQDNSEQSSSRKTHNTRLRNGIHKAKQTIEIKYNDRKEASNGKDKEKHALIDACARDLAEVDRESFQRSFFEDANNIFERLFLPMHFPWSHRAQKFDQEIRAMPCDIDDMFVVPTGNDSDDDEQEEDDEACEGDTVSCNRSAQDKGVIEIGHDRGAKRPKRHLNIAMEKQQVPHVNDFAYRMYQEVQSRKHHQAEKESEAPRCLLSIQCHGVSSKASIFTDVPDGKTALLLPAIQPRDIATGKRMAIAKAKEVSDQLGSYDCRHGLPNNTEEREQSGRRRRVFAGRTRMIWTRKEEDDKKLASPSTRPTYTSIITGETIPNGLHKRPLSVKVGFRLDGRLVTVDKSATECTTETLELALKSGEDCQVSHDANMVDKAFERPFTRSNAVANPKKPSPRRSTELRNGSRKKSH